MLITLTPTLVFCLDPLKWNERLLFAVGTRRRSIAIFTEARKVAHRRANIHLTLTVGNGGTVQHSHRHIFQARATPSDVTASCPFEYDLLH